MSAESDGDTADLLGVGAEGDDEQDVDFEPGRGRQLDDEGSLAAEEKREKPEEVASELNALLADSQKPLTDVLQLYGNAALAESAGAIGLVSKKSGSKRKRNGSAVANGLASAATSASAAVTMPTKAKTTATRPFRGRRFNVGAKVVARYLGGELWYRGEVTAVDSRNALYDIRYDDGDVELRVPHERVVSAKRALPSAGKKSGSKPGRGRRGSKTKGEVGASSASSAGGAGGGQSAAALLVSVRAKLAADTVGSEVKDDAVAAELRRMRAEIIGHVNVETEESESGVTSLPPSSSSSFSSSSPPPTSTDPSKASLAQLGWHPCLESGPSLAAVVAGGSAARAKDEPKAAKCHREYLLAEMQWLSSDFDGERRWKEQRRKKLAAAVRRHFARRAGAKQRAEKERVRKVRMSRGKQEREGGREGSKLFGGDTH